MAKDLVKRSFRITFTRKAQDGESIDHPGWFDSRDKRVIDSTEFDVSSFDYTCDEYLPELINLFNAFTAENNFDAVEVVQIDEVPYDGD